jgi:hypothetical protein
MNILRELYAYMSVLPFIIFAIVFFIHFYWKRNHRRAIMRAMDATTFFLIGADAGLTDLLFGFSFSSIWLFILVFLLAFGLIGNVQHRTKGRVDAARALRIVWRFGFFLLSLLYVLLLPAGIVMYLLR